MAKISKQKLRKLWAEALRSGKYGWGKKALNPEPGKFCCLGVLCEVAKEHGLIHSYKPGFYLSERVQKLVGLSSNSGNSLSGSINLALINDESDRNPFRRIAKLLDNPPEGLFIEDK